MKIVITGARSEGKTVLAEVIRSHLRTLGYGVAPVVDSCPEDRRGQPGTLNRRDVEIVVDDSRKDVWDRKVTVDW